MLRYIDLSQSTEIHKLLVRLSPLSKAECDELSKQFSNLPVDYTDFLTEIGNGIIGQRQYMLYDGVLPLSELLGDTCDPNLAHLLVFGDTTGGTCHAFDPTNEMRVTAVDLETQETEIVAMSFNIFIHSLLAAFIRD